MSRVFVPDDGMMRVWASQGYCKMTIEDNFYDGEVTYNVHPRHLKEINGLKVGDLVTTPSEEIGLIVDKVDIDLQGFIIFKVLIKGEELMYSSLELAIIGE